MTISTENRKAGPFTGNGVTTVFPFTFKVFSAADLTVVRADLQGAETTLVLDTDYTATLNENQNTDPGGSITLSSPLTAGYVLVVTTTLGNLQPTDLTNNGGFFPQVITNSLDRLTILVQQLTERVGRALRVSITTPDGINPELPTPAADSLIGWNSSGDGLVNFPTTTALLGTALSGPSGSSLVGFLQAGTGAVARTAQAKMRDVVSVKDFGAVGDGVTDDTAAIQAAITAAGVGGIVMFSGVHAISATIRPLSQQCWVGRGGGECTLYFTATTSDPAVEFTTTGSFATIENIGFLATTGFTGAAFKFNASLNCVLRGSLIRNILNGIGVMFEGASFYNEASNIKVTSCGVGLRVTGLSPNCPNNNIVDNFDVYGASGVGTAMYSDSNCSMFTLRNFISEAECATNVLRLTDGGYEFISPRFECTARPSGDFFDISGASVRFVGQQFKIQKATHSSIRSDLNNLSGRTFQNLIPDPLFIGDLAGGATPPTGWTVFTGSFSSIAKSTSTPNVGVFGSSLEMVTSAASSGIGYQLGTAAVLALMRGKTARIHALTWFSSPGTSCTAFIRQEGGAGGATSQVSENVIADTWHVHSCELSIPSDATLIHFRLLLVGSGGTFRLWSPVLEIDGSLYTFTKGGYDIPYLYNGMFIGDLGLRITNASAAPTTGTWKRGDRVFNRLPTVGQPKSWVCTVAGTPGTWVSEGNL